MNKIAVFDIGNTLLRKPQKDIGLETLHTLQLLRGKGYFIGIATMRNLTMLSDVLKQFPFDFMVTLNGAYIEAMNEVIVDIPMDSFLLERLIKEIELKNLEYKLYSKYEIHNSFDKEVTYYGMELIKVHDISQIIQKFSELVFYIWEKGESCDIHSIEVSKGKAMQEVIKYLNVPLQNTIAFGDGFNDIELFKSCHTSVAMDTAPEELKEYATIVTNPNVENKIYWALKQLEIL